MSDDSGAGQNTSFFSNLKNKVRYNLHQAVYDPNANQFAEQRKEAAQQAQQQQEEAKAAATDTDTGDPNKFSASRLAKKIGNQAWQAIQAGFPAFLALMLAMIVTNDLIVYAAPIRIIFFIFTFAICYYAQAAGLLLGFFYLLKGGYSYYYNNMTDRPKREIMPTIFALAPITTYKPMSSLAGFFMYPFTYPKTEISAQKLPIIMKQYWGDLQESFKDLDTVKNLPIFADALKSIQKDLASMHNQDIPVVNTQTVAPIKNNQNSEPVKNITNQSTTPANNQNNAKEEKGI
jgi:hypothetical protein